MTLLLVRHAVAMRRREWHRSDDLRPLTPRGERQAHALVQVLRPFAVTRALTSPSVRCVDTIEPFAATVGLPLERRDELREGSGTAVLPLLDALDDEVVAACSHGDVLLDLVQVVASDAVTVEGADLETFEKGAVWVIEKAAGGGVAARYLAPPERVSRSGR